MNPLLALKELGQSPWLDYIRRDLLTSGELKRLVEVDGVSGVTSNPTIFEKAIAGTSAYDAQLKALLHADRTASAETLYEAVAIADVQAAADVLRPVYDAASGHDGFVSLEVAPRLAHDADATVADAKRLWAAVARPNLMIKVPATRAGMRAIETLIGEGINVNVTLIFGLADYAEVVAAYVRGLMRAPDPSRVASVASFFVSRIDTAVDMALAAVTRPEAAALKGRIAIANARAAYRQWSEVFDSEYFDWARDRGGRAQRLLWASTGTKDPAYSDVLYIEELIGPDTVNTLPPATLDAFRDHGKARVRLDEGVDEAEAALDKLGDLGISLSAITARLLDEGLKAFADSYDKLIAALEGKRAALLGAELDRQTMTLGGYEAAVTARLERFQGESFGRRLWARDTTLWSQTSVAELSDRLGWLMLHETMRPLVPALEALAAQVCAEGVRHVVVLGMGGSSLAPEVYQRTFGSAPGYPELLVLDSTHPAAVRAVERRIDAAKTLFLVSSKSGTTTEPLSFMRWFWEVLKRAGREPGRHFIAITDPGTPLERLAAERGFRRVFRATSDVGGRYSALTAFGLVPAALLGVPVRRLLDEALTMAESSDAGVDAKKSPALALGAALGELALAGRDKLTFVCSPGLSAFPDWIEQLIAESTGKDDKGILPVADEALGEVAVYGNDRVFIGLSDKGDDPRLEALAKAGHPVLRYRLDEKTDLGQEILRWELATAVAGAVMGIQPFNQPDVELAKNLAREALASAGKGASGEVETIAAGDKERLGTAIFAWLGTVRAGDYIAVQAYLPASPALSARLNRLRTRLRDKLRLATTLGYGPRFLHSTGQLHKGGPDTGLYLQIVDEPSEALPVPESDYSFATLIAAQSVGDYLALKQRGRRILRVSLGRDVDAGLGAIEAAIA